MPDTELAVDPQEREMKINASESEEAESELSSQEDLENFAKTAVEDIDGETNEVDDGIKSFENANQSIGLDEAGVIETKQEIGADKELEAVQQEIGQLTQETKQRDSRRRGFRR